MAGSGNPGFMNPVNGVRDIAAITFLVQQMLAGVATATLVKVQKVTNTGAAAPVGFVDLLPLVNLIDGAGVTMPHATIFQCPYFRLQGGANAVILDPQPGDLGIAVFADRDISSASRAKGPASPGSARRFSMADALYIGGVLNGTPSQFVRFSASGIEISSPTGITLDAPTVTMNTTGGVAITSASLTHNGVNIGATHVHNDPQGGVVSPPH